MLGFKDFVLNENKAYFARQVHDVLTSVHDVSKDKENLGSRQMVKLGTNIVNQIRRILHSPWETDRLRDLAKLQAVAVMLAKIIEEKGDVKVALDQVSSELETLSNKLGNKTNTLGEKIGTPVKQAELPITGQPPPEMPPGGPGQPPSGPEMGGMPPLQGQEMIPPGQPPPMGGPPMPPMA